MAIQKVTEVIAAEFTGAHCSSVADEGDIDLNAACCKVQEPKYGIPVDQWQGLNV